MIDKDYTEELIKGLRKLADLYENNPHLVPPQFSSTIAVTVYCKTKDEFLTCVKAVGSGKKEAYSGSFEIRHNLSKAVRLDINVQRELVCKRNVVGTRVIPAQLLPERVEEVVEWVCPESLFEPTGGNHGN